MVTGGAAPVAARWRHRMAAKPPTVSKLDDDTVNGRLAEIPAWEFESGALRRVFVFDDFVGAFGF